MTAPLPAGPPAAAVPAPVPAAPVPIGPVPIAGGPLAARTCWLLDLDGTLVDSAPAHERAYRAALAQLWPPGLAGFRYGEHAGRPTAEVVAALGAPDPGPLVRRKQALYRAYVDDGLVTILPGAVELLAELARRGRPAHVVTGASRASAERVLRATGLAGLVTGLVAAEDVAAGKPDPAAYREALRRFAPGGAGTAVAVEDSSAGVRAALGAGLLTVQVAGPTVPGAVAAAGLDGLHRLLTGPPGGGSGAGGRSGGRG